jgi:vitamin B12 transporter
MNQQKLLAAFLCAVTPLAYAASNNEPLEILVTTGTRIEQPLSQSLTDTTVITAQDIRNSQAPDVLTVLKDVAGLEVAQSGGVGQQSSLFMRGTNSDHVLVLVDGVRVDSVSTGTTALDQLMLDQIDHIEVVRGNASSLYGSSAIGGVIQIFTKHGMGKPFFKASAGAGSLNTQRGSVGFGGQSGATNFNIQASRFKTDGVSAINPVILPGANPDRDGYNNTSYSANVRQAFNPGNSISVSALRSHGNTQFDNPFNLAVTDTNTSVSNLGKFSLASDNRLNEIWQSKLQWSESVDDTKNYLNGQPDTGNGYYYQTTNRQLTWQNNLTLEANANVVLGAEKLIQQLASDTVYTNTQRTDNSFFGGYVGNYGAHQMQVNLRQDQYSDFGSANTGLLGYGYKLSASWRATASYSTAFRAPTFNDLYYPLSFGYQGNPNLQPERSHNTEAGMHYGAGRQHIDLVYFNNEITNLIACNTLCSTVINIDKARISGTELIYSGQFDNTGAKASLTSQNPRDASTGTQLSRRSRLFGNLGISERLGAWQFGGEWLYSGTRVDAGHTLAAYNVFNLIASFAFSQEVKLMLRADNLTNQNNSSIYGYNALGRTLFASVSYQP